MKEIEILGICGSPRKSATDFVVKWSLDFIHEKYGLKTHYFSVRGKKINFCFHCDYCLRKKSGCVHEDDLQSLYPLMEQSQAWILASPVYHGHISAQLKAILDRTRALMAKKKTVFENKIGAGFAVGGDRNGGQEHVLHTILDFYLINKMIPVSGGAFGANLGGSIWSQDKGKSGAEKDEEGLKSIKMTINRLIKVTNLVLNKEF